MRKLLIASLASLVVLLASTLTYAQGARNASPLTITAEGKSNFTAIGLQGLDTVGNPGYIEMRGVTAETSETAVAWYLWIDELGQLRIASYIELSPFASFPTGSWASGNMQVGRIVGPRYSPHEPGASSDGYGTEGVHGYIPFVENSFDPHSGNGPVSGFGR